MNGATRPALLNSQANPFNLRAISLFHSTPFLDRRRRTHWDSAGGAYRDSSKRFDPYSKRYRKLQSKQQLLRNVGAFAEHLFQGWRNGFDESDSTSSKESDSTSSKDSSWFRRDYGAKYSKTGFTGTKGPFSAGRSSFHFCDDDNDIETIMFQSAFGGNKHFYWSFIEEDFPPRWQSSSGHRWSFIEEDFPPRWRSSSGHQNKYRTSWNWRHGEEEDYGSSTESDSSESDLVSYRLALGLSASGPLELDDVKNAYRTCAMKWHPDRHQGSSKAVAEEKFKACSAAYQSLCDKMA